MSREKDEGNSSGRSREPVRSPPVAVREAEEAAPAESGPSPGEETAGESSADPDEGEDVSSEDREFLAILEKGSGEGEGSELEGFVAAHPSHILARAMLIDRLLGKIENPASIRPHVEALRHLLPGEGLPDLLLARLEMLEGRRELARNLLLQAGEKDFAWLPNPEILRLAVEDALQSENFPSLAFLKSMGVPAPFGKTLRDLARDIIPPQNKGKGGAEDEKDPGEDASRGARPDPEEARAILKLGRAMADHGGTIIHNLIGSSLVKGSLDALAATGNLTEEERRLLDWIPSIQAVALQFGSRVNEILLTDPDFCSSFLANTLAHGERRAARRALMDHYRREIDRE